MHETLRIVERIRPKYVLWENVKNILSKKHKHNFDKYLEKMEQLGYKNYYHVLNAKDYGIPQNRERIYTISIKKDIDKRIYNFPKKENLQLKLKDILEDKVNEKYYISQIENGKIILTSKCKRLETLIKNIKLKENEILNLDLYNQKTNPNISQCLTEPHHNSQRLFDGYRIRKLTPKECWRLMGFSDKDFEKAKNAQISDTQLYKQAGNSIVVKVLEKIFIELLNNRDKKNINNCYGKILENGQISIF